MKFFCITNQKNPTINLLLENACKKQKVEYVHINEHSFNFLDIPNTSGHIVYRTSISSLAISIEAAIHTKSTISFYKKSDNTQDISFNPAFQDIIFEKNGMNTPKTIHHISHNKQILKNYVQKLGDFPIIVKIEGESHGDGVLQIDSMPSLNSILDVISKKNSHIKFKKFIQTKTSKRLIIINNEVVDSIEYITQKDEFRSNVGKNPTVISKKFSKQVESMAIKAVKVLGVEFGGVDILEDDMNKNYVIEVNYPCNFARAQTLTKTNIAEQMITYLKTKSPNQTQS